MTNPMDGNQLAFEFATPADSTTQLLTSTSPLGTTSSPIQVVSIRAFRQQKILTEEAEILNKALEYFEKQRA